jgi:hypothetical protein
MSKEATLFKKKFKRGDRVRLKGTDIEGTVCVSIVASETYVRFPFTPAFLEDGNPSRRPRTHPSAL